MTQAAANAIRFTVSHSSMSKPEKLKLPAGHQLSSDELLEDILTTLNFKDPSNDEGPKETRSYTLSREDASDATGLVPRLWAQRKVAELAVLAEEHDDELLALGRRFGIVTPGASLLVLETLEQHLEHGVEPAKSRR